MDALSELNVNTSTVILVAGTILSLIVILVLMLYIRHLRSRLNNFENPRYGFLGKTIYPVLGLFTLGSVIFFASYGVLSPDTPDSQADYQVTGQINAQVKSQTLAIVNVDLSFVPHVSGQPWGNVNDKFDIYWDISGPIEVSRYELQKSKFDPSGIVVSLPKGNYDVGITVVYQGKSTRFTDRLS